MSSILIVDDEKEIRELIDIYLKNEGYHTLKAANGEEAIQLIKQNDIHLVLLDIMMPKMDGIQTCIEIRKNYNMPIIFLTAKIQEIDIIHGLTSGADDYMAKPFNPLELIARVKYNLRRYINLQGYKKEENENTIFIDDLVIFTDRHEVRIGETEIKLTPREFEILSLLAKNKGKVFSSENIFESIWKEDSIHCDNTVMVHIRKIREKIETNPRTPKYIKTVWGVGYKVES